ncbi:MAG TPA: hypothetical protein VKD90_24080 [Gemmataceae bacterium]|nr:hypothetical protein [Gemmataceae bacterium]
MFGFFKKQPARPNGPDFSRIDSQAKAVAMYRKGDLEKLFLMPLEFGGQDIPDNTLYVPIGVAEVKAGIDLNVIRPLIEAEKVSQYTVEPEYQGESFIPIALKIRAWDPGEFTTTINIWGDALGRE